MKHIPTMHACDTAFIESLSPPFLHLWCTITVSATGTHPYLYKSVRYVFFLDQGNKNPIPASNFSSSMTRQWPQVWNTRPGGVLIFAPPCATWVFLSTASTGRTWANPEGNGSKCCVLANIFCRRMIYMSLCMH